MIILVSTFTFAYIFFTALLWYYWQKIEVFSVGTALKSKVLVSVIIPVRNEASNIVALLEDLDKQCWQDGKYFTKEQLEVIIVNDQSEDESVNLIRSFHSLHFKLRILHLELPQDFKGSHKKLAISQAISISKGDIIITTDGDCSVGCHWIAILVLFMDARKAEMVSAPVTFLSGQSLFENLQLIEFASLIGTGAACMKAGFPNMCNGANLAFTKRVFQKVNGYEGSMHIPSGDDEFLMQKIFKLYPESIFFLKHKEAVVSTRAQESIKHFYHQRKRWAGKWKLHKSITTALLALFIFTFHALLIGAVVLSIAGAFPWYVILVLLLLKAIVEFLFLKAVLKSMQKALVLSNFLLLQLIYSLYAVFFGIVANFGGYQWKKRQYT